MMRFCLRAPETATNLPWCKIILEEVSHVLRCSAMASHPAKPPSGHHIRRRILEKGIPKKRVVAETRISRKTINEMAIKALGKNGKIST